MTDDIIATSEQTMIAVRLDKKDWGKALRAMIAIAPVRLIAADPMYEVLPAHLELLSRAGFPTRL